jgi:hypothetical protein
MASYHLQSFQEAAIPLTVVIAIVPFLAVFSDELFRHAILLGGEQDAQSHPQGRPSKSVCLTECQPVPVELFTGYACVDVIVSQVLDVFLATRRTGIRMPITAKLTP